MLVFGRYLKYTDVCYYFTENCDGVRKDRLGAEIMWQGCFGLNRKKVTYLCDFRINVIYIFKKLQTSVTPGWGAPDSGQVRQREKKMFYFTVYFRNFNGKNIYTNTLPDSLNSHV